MLVFPGTFAHSQISSKSQLALIYQSLSHEETVTSCDSFLARSIRDRQGPVVQKLNSAIHRINFHPVNKH